MKNVIFYKIIYSDHCHYDFASCQPATGAILPEFLNDKVNFCLNKEASRRFLCTFVPSFDQCGIRYQISPAVICVHREKSILQLCVYRCGTSWCENWYTHIVTVSVHLLYSANQRL